MTLKWLQRRSWDDVFRKRVPGVGSGDRKSSAADGSQSDWRHDLRVCSGRTQSSSTTDINSRGERPQIPWCVAVEDFTYFTDYRNVAAEMCTCRTTRILRYRDSLASHQWYTRSSMKALLTTTSHWYDFPQSWRSMTTSSRSVCPAHPHLPMPTASLSDGATMVSKTWLFDCPIPTPIQFINLYV